MKTLLLLRHAKSDWHDPSLADHDRPLNDRGRRDAPRMGRLLVEAGVLPDLILCSTARRARETAEGVAAEAGYRGETRYVDALYHGEPEDLVAVLGEVEPQADRVLVIAHNPGLETFLHELTGRLERLPTAALACIRLPITAWDQLHAAVRGTLEAMWRPREIDAGPQGRTGRVPPGAASPG